MNKELPPFKTGDRVVCVKTHSQDKDKKGEIKTVLATKQCRFGMWTIDIGLKINVTTRHDQCGKRFKQDGIGWIGVPLFRLIDPYSEDCREELAQAAMTDRIETDGVVREIVKN